MDGEDQSVDRAEEAAAPTLTGSHTDEAERAPVTIESALLIVESVDTSSDFTATYDEAVDVLEDHYIEQAFAAMRELQPERAAQYLGQAKMLRTAHLELVDAALIDQDHELRPRLVRFQKSAASQLSLIGWLAELAESMAVFRRGEWDLAIEKLNSQTTILSDESASGTTPVMTLLAGAAGEVLGGEIRSAVQDFAGARAAFDRSVALFLQAREVVRERTSDYEPPTHPRRYAEAASHAARLAMLVRANEYRGGAEVARAAAEAFKVTAEALVKEDPASSRLMAPIIRARERQFLGTAHECEAEIALEDGIWDSATEHAKEAQRHYEEGSKECLVSLLPIGRILQEQMLNSSFSWGVQFGKRLDRERQARERLETVRSELQEFYRAVRDALRPAGLTIENRADAVNSVSQQVEMVARIENHARELLREIPGALLEAGLSEEERASFVKEANALAAESESGPNFLRKVGDFAARLQTAVVRTGEVAAPILALLKALRVLG